MNALQQLRTIHAYILHFRLTLLKEEIYHLIVNGLITSTDSFIAFSPCECLRSFSCRAAELGENIKIGAKKSTLMGERMDRSGVGRNRAGLPRLPASRRSKDRFGPDEPSLFLLLRGMQVLCQRKQKVGC